MLILGATGTGKTSQILLPMIDQDIKYGRGVFVFEPKGDLAEQVAALFRIYKRKDGFFFDPTAPDCPYYNVFDGPEEVIVETVITTFLAMSSNSSNPYWNNMTDNLLRKAILVIKRLEVAYTNPDTGISEKPATMTTLNDLICNTNNRGRDMVNELSIIPTLTDSEAKQNIDTKDWFLNEYFNENSKAYQDNSNIRAQVSKLCNNKFLLKVLNPPNGKSDINFDKILEEGQCISMTISQGILGELGKTLGYFLVLNLERAIFRRKGRENTRKHCFLYVDEFQMFSNRDFVTLLEQGRAYRVSLILATQSRSGIRMGAGVNGDSFLHSIETNTRNTVLLPDLHPDDAKFFEEKYGKHIVLKERTNESHAKFSLFGDNGKPATEGKSWEEVEESRMSASDIRYKPFKEISYQLINGENSVEYARVGKANFVDKNLKELIDAVVDEYQTEQDRKREEIQRQNATERANKIRDFLSSRSANPKRNNTLNGVMNEKKVIFNASNTSRQPETIWKTEESKVKPVFMNNDIPAGIVINDDDEDFIE